MHSHWQAWVKRDIQSILNEPAITTLKDGPFIGIHVRRGDKIGTEAKSYEVQVKIYTIICHIVWCSGSDVVFSSILSNTHVVSDRRLSHPKIPFTRANGGLIKIYILLGKSVYYK